ncbi:ATP-binding protein [Sphingomonas sp. GB1N7]|uniref:ATP-binding protein n=1 Tax=Parasphingomonas caseinilytica TaxID=3096158 RepID=UPI002FC90CC4
MDAVRNPYAPGAGNPPPELAGRTEVLETAKTALARVALRRSVQFPILVGLRGVGKTVLLVRIKEMADMTGYLTIDIEAHEGKTLPQLIVPGIRKCLFALSGIENAKEKARRGLRILKGFLGGLTISVGDIDIGIDAERGVADSGDLEADLPEMLVSLGEAAAAANRPVAIIIDELQYLSPPEFSALIMAMHKINQRSLPLVLVGAGLPQILGLAGNSKSYAERLFSYPKIGALAEIDAIAAMVNPAEDEGVTIDANAVQEIMRLTERYPYFIQQWSHDAWNIAQGPTITKSDVERATPISIASLDQSFFQVRFDRCTPSEKKYMRALAELGPGQHRSGDIAERLSLSTTSAAPTRSALIKKGMIYSPIYGDTAFTVPLFDDYMRRAMPLARKGDGS